MTDCIFCEIIAGNALATIVDQWDDAIAIQPRNPVTPGHTLVIPRQHVTDVGTNQEVTAAVAARAAELAAGLPAANVITSKGAAATQTVFHLHFHVVPRRTGDGLPLPWTPQQDALDANRRGINVVWAREPIPAGPSIFLAGPTPRTASVDSWRDDAIGVIAACWNGTRTLNVLTPESRGGNRATEYHDQVEWETQGLDSATVVAFWIPRDVRTLPGFTTNIEFGLYARSGRVVLGAPADCPNPERNRYPIWVARRYGVPVFRTLPDTMLAAIDMVA